VIIRLLAYILTSAKFTVKATKEIK